MAMSKSLMTEKFLFFLKFDVVHSAMLDGCLILSALQLCILSIPLHL